MRCGELCKSCVGRCGQVVSPHFPADIECQECGGQGCSECEDGYFSLTQCPSEFIGQDLISDIRLITATEHHLPVAGGLLDQSAWWFELKTLLASEENRVQAEQEKRRSYDN